MLLDPAELHYFRRRRCALAARTDESGRSCVACGKPGHLSDSAGIRIRRGVMTGANDVLLLSMWSTCSEVSHGFAQAARARPTTTTPQRSKATASAPVLRGSDVRAWRAAPSCHVVWLYDQHLRSARRPGMHGAISIVTTTAHERPGNPAPGASFDFRHLCSTASSHGVTSPVFTGSNTPAR